MSRYYNSIIYPFSNNKKELSELTGKFVGYNKNQQMSDGLSIDNFNDHSFGKKMMESTDYLFIGNVVIYIEALRLGRKSHTLQVLTEQFPNFIFYEEIRFEAGGISYRIAKDDLIIDIDNNHLKPYSYNDANQLFSARMKEIVEVAK